MWRVCLLTARSAAAADAAVAADASAAPLVEFRDVQIRYDADSTVFAPPLNWTVREGENWGVVGGNGAGKTTLVELISGDNVLGYTQVRSAHSGGGLCPLA